MIYVRPQKKAGQHSQPMSHIPLSDGKTACNRRYGNEWERTDNRARLCSNCQREYAKMKRLGLP